MEEHSSIEVTNLCVDFRTEASGFQYLKELITRRATGARRRFRAIRGVGFKIRSGSITGIVGPNGCGKSTLLRVLAGIYPPSEGQVTVRGRVALLAGLGVGFQGDLTGRENLRLGGIVAGLEREAISAIEADVIEFSGIEAEFIDRPLRTYSSGMKARLGFSLASHMAPDILLIDEVFAVGDPAFRSRSRERILEMVRSNATVVMVTHSMGLVKDLCDRTLCMASGEIRLDTSDADAAIAMYRDLCVK